MDDNTHTLRGPYEDPSRSISRAPQLDDLPSTVVLKDGPSICVQCFICPFPIGQVWTAFLSKRIRRRAWPFGIVSRISQIIVSNLQIPLIC